MTGYKFKVYIDGKRCADIEAENRVAAVKKARIDNAAPLYANITVIIIPE
jgi:hypothetical protein